MHLKRHSAKQMFLPSYSHMQDYPPTTSAYLSLLARILVQNTAFFSSFLAEMASQAQQLVQSYHVTSSCDCSCDQSCDQSCDCSCDVLSFRPQPAEMFGLLLDQWSDKVHSYVFMWLCIHVTRVAIARDSEAQFPLSLSLSPARLHDKCSAQEAHGAGHCLSSTTGR